MNFVMSQSHKYYCVPQIEIVNTLQLWYDCLLLYILDHENYSKFSYVYFPWSRIVYKFLAILVSKI